MTQQPDRFASEKLAEPDSQFDEVDVLHFDVADLTKDDLVRQVAKLAHPDSEQTRVFALHIGGLLSRHDQLYRRAMDNADLVYADGISTVILARLSGARHIQRLPTTDLGWGVFATFKNHFGKPPRIAAVGGPEGLAPRALETVGTSGFGTPVFSTHGFHSDWDEVLGQLSDSRPDIVLVGLGAPAEMKWIDRHRSELPDALILSCGGWFGYLVGEEARAPRLLRDTGFEWAYRLKLQPRRLGSRYLRGAVLFPLLVGRVVAGRLRGAAGRLSHPPGHHE